MKRSAPLLLCMLALAACSGKPPQPQATDAPAARTATPWDGMKKTEQKAKDVQKASDQQAEREQKALDAAGQ